MNVPIIFLALSIAGALTAQFAPAASGHKAMPVTDDGPAEPGNARRAAENLQHNQPASDPLRGTIRELPSGMEELPLISHWWRNVPAIPTGTSDLIFVGVVLDAQAYLSADRSRTYSEFTVQVSQILKDEPRADSAAQRTRVILERSGGAVRFPSGRIQRYSQLMQGFPEAGKSYVMFAKSTDVPGDFFLLTAYEVKDGRVWALDGPWSYNSFDGNSMPDFLVAVRRTIAGQ